VRESAHVSDDRHPDGVLDAFAICCHASAASSRHWPLTRRPVSVLIRGHEVATHVDGTPRVTIETAAPFSER
jgi:hypothetical protein